RSSSRSSGPSYTFPTVTENGNALSSFSLSFPVFPESFFAELAAATDGVETSPEPEDSTPGCPISPEGRRGTFVGSSPGDVSSGFSGFNSSVIALPNPHRRPHFHHRLLRPSGSPLLPVL